MADDNASPRASPPEALAEEVRRLKALLLEVQSELKPALQSSLRERSAELQRIGGELAEQQDEAARLKRALDEALARQAELEREATRWREAATRGLDEIEGRAREAQARFEAQAAELNQALDALRVQLDASSAQADAAVAAREGAMADQQKARRRAAALKVKVLRREAGRMAMRRSLSWRITAPLRGIGDALQAMALGGARLRRRLMKR